MLAIEHLLGNSIRVFILSKKVICKNINTTLESFQSHLCIHPELPEFAVGGTDAEASEASEAVEAAAVTAGVTNGLSDRIGSERIESAGLDS